MRPISCLVFLFVCLPVTAQSTASAPTPVALTNPKAVADAQKYRDVLYRLNPELGSNEGYTKYDTKIADVSLSDVKSKHKDLDGALKKLAQTADKEPDPDAQKELRAYVEYQQALLQQEDEAINHQVSYIDAAAYIAYGLKPLMDGSASNARHIAGGERMKRYAGIDPDPAGGNSKLTENASISRSTAPMTGVSQGLGSDNSLVTALINRTTAQMKKPGMAYPSRADVVYGLEHTNEVVNGILASFRQDNMSNWETAFAALQREIIFYDDWVKTNLLPKAK